MEGIKWSKYFDAVYCLSLADNTQRRVDMTKELRRVGIFQSRIFKWKITVRNEFYHYIWTNPDFHTERWWLHLESAMNATMGHYEIMKESLALNHERILIIEDDIRFLKDLQELSEILNEIPEYDVLLLDKCLNVGRESYQDALENNGINGHFFNFNNVKLWSVGCYGLSRKAMQTITKRQESLFIPADHVTNRVDNKGNVVNDDGLVRVASIRNAAMQDFKYKKQLSALDEIVYNGIADPEEYAL